MESVVVTAPCGGSRPIGKRTRRAERVPRGQYAGVRGLGLAPSLKILCVSESLCLCVKYSSAEVMG